MQSVRKCLKSSTYQGIRSSGLWSKQCAFCYDLTLNDADLISLGNNPIQRKVTGNTRPVHTAFHSTIKVTFCSKFILTVHEAFLVFWLQFLQSASARLSARRNSQLMPAPHLWSEYMWQLCENINIWIRIYINIYLVGGCVVNWIIEPIIVSPESITITITIVIFRCRIALYRNYSVSS